MIALKRFLHTMLIFCAILALPYTQTFADNHGADGTIAGENMPRIRLSTTLGDIVLELDQAKAPKSVENFLAYVDEGFYNGTIFHRVIDGFMVQGGGFTQDFMKKPTRPPVENEANNGLKNLRGTVAMARTNDPHSATAQFFINVVDNDFLDHRSPTPRGWGYAVFGQVVEGMDVIDTIRRTPTGSGGPFPRDVPRTPVVILTATVDGVMPNAPMPSLAPSDPATTIVQ